MHTYYIYVRKRNVRNNIPQRIEREMENAFRFVLNCNQEIETYTNIQIAS